MLILEVALGVALGLVVFRFFPQILGATAAFGVLAAILAVAVGVLALLAVLVMLNFELVAAVVGAIAAMALLYGLPFYLKGKIDARFPRLKLIVAGEAPYDKASSLPLRLIVMIPLALTFAGAGVGALAGALHLVDLFSRLFDGR